MLAAAITQPVVEKHFGIHRTTINGLWHRFRATSSNADRVSSGHHENIPI